ncbi:MAG: toxin-antitoxin system YwqK family antitoxin [Bacteroidota bacterium]|jgi:antitoxin component YwqK of YwqJK toxin-antitoxin module
MNKRNLFTTIIFFIFIEFILSQGDTNKVKNDGYNIFFYDNGIKSSEGLMRSGKPDGYWKNYYQNGNLKNEGNRKNYLLDSVWKFYTDAGKLNRIINYGSGKKNGYTITYDTSGKILSKENYNNDYKTGNSYNFYLSGKTHFIIPYKNGKIDGEVLELSEDSILIGITVYKSGFIEKTENINRKDKNGVKQGKWKEFDLNGNLKKEMNYRDGSLDGYIKEYDNKGNLITVEKYFSGKKIDNPKELKDIKFYKEYYSGRQIKFEGGYLDNYPHGFHYYYNINGKIDSAIYYEEGFALEKGKMDSLNNKTGLWIELYQTGELKGKGQYFNGKKTGYWKYWYPSGKEEQSGKFDKNGNQIDNWKWYYENGNVLRDENFIAGKRNGFFSDYLEDGKIIESGEYVEDQKEGFWIYQMGNYIEKGNYLQGERDSVWNAWWSTTGKLRYKGSWLSGSAEGKHMWYYENGKKMVEGFFMGGSKNGNWYFFNEEGELFLTIEFDNDEEVAFNGTKLTSEYEKAVKSIDQIKTKKRNSTE